MQYIVDKMNTEYGKSSFLPPHAIFACSNSDVGMCTSGQMDAEKENNIIFHKKLKLI